MIARFALSHPWAYLAVLVGLMLLLGLASERINAVAAMLPRPGEENE
jgi:hypothetical protein